MDDLSKPEVDPPDPQGTIARPTRNLPAAVASVATPQPTVDHSLHAAASPVPSAAPADHDALHQATAAAFPASRSSPNRRSSRVGVRVRGHGRPFGSHMYDSHHNATEQVGLGMLGPLIVVPRERNVDPSYDTDELFILNEALGGFTINGKGFPATARCTAVSA
jgi:hypothetical protein